MPLLTRETYLFPEDLLESTFDGDESSSPSSPSAWWALYTVSRNEKALMRKLLAQGQHFYCPVVAKRHRVAGGGVRTSYLPLFSNYVFLQGDEYARYRAVCSGHVSRYLPIVDVDRFVEQMRSVWQMINAEVPIEVQARLAVGKLVPVKSGPLKGRQGFVLQERNRQQFVVNVELLGQAVSTLLDGWELEPV